MNSKEKITITLIIIISTILSYIIVEKYDFKIRMLPRCAGMGFYSYFDNEKGRCSCYGGYVLKDKICIKKY